MKAAVLHELLEGGRDGWGRARDRERTGDGKSGGGQGWGQGWGTNISDKMTRTEREGEGATREKKKDD